MKILFAGEGGQGVQVIAEILAKAAFSEGKQVSYIPNFGVEQRGGASLAFVTIDEKKIFYPKFAKADFLVVLADRAYERVKDYQADGTKTVFGPATQEGIKTDLPSKTWNLFVLGKVNKIGKIVKVSNLIKVMEQRFARQFTKNPELKKLDLLALQA